jgi:uncharacterized protein YqeY
MELVIMKLETIQESIKIAMKTHATLEVETLRAVVAAVKKAAIDRRCEITEDLVDEMLLKEVKIIKEQIDTCPESRTELKDEYEHRLMIVENFAPKLIIDEAKIENMINAALAREGLVIETVSNKGQIMKIVMPQLKGKVDMKIANQVIAKLFE